LLIERGAAAQPSPIHIMLGRGLHRMPIKSVVLVKARIFGRNDRMLQIR